MGTPQPVLLSVRGEVFYKMGFPDTVMYMGK